MHVSENNLIFKCRFLPKTDEGGEMCIKTEQLDWQEKNLTLGNYYSIRNGWKENMTALNLPVMLLLQEKQKWPDLNI